MLGIAGKRLKEEVTTHPLSDRDVFPHMILHKHIPEQLIFS
jgi:hypothetical protein